MTFVLVAVVFVRLGQYSMFSCTERNVQKIIREERGYGGVELLGLSPLLQAASGIGVHGLRPERCGPFFYVIFGIGQGSA